MHHAELQRFLSKGELVLAKKVKNIELENKLAILITGKAIKSNNENIEAPCLVNDKSLTLSRDSRLFICS
jgi:predicted transcriptional regulator